MANLKIKKLSRLPIGTHIELTFGDSTSHPQTVSGIITDSDFSESFEVTSYNGDVRVLDYSIVLGFAAVKTIDTVLKKLKAGDNVHFSFGSEENVEPNIKGTVIDNDCEESLEIKTDSGKEIVLDYSVIRSLLVESSHAKGVVASDAKQSKPQPAFVEEKTNVSVPRFNREPDNVLNASDNRLKEIFDELPREDRKKLSGAYDRFKYGVKTSDRGKMKDAAIQARQILFHDDDDGYYWSYGAAVFCGCMLSRTGVFDHQVLLVGECFDEAAYACWREEKYSLAGAYAILAFMEGEVNNSENLTTILTGSIVKADDISGLKVLCEKSSGEHSRIISAVLNDAFEAKGIRVAVSQDTATAIRTLETLYPNLEMGKEVISWLPDDIVESTEDDLNEEISENDEEKKPLYGVISKLNWAVHTGIITADNNKTFTFDYKDILDPTLKSTIENCLRSDLGGETCHVQFMPNDNAAIGITPTSRFVERARAIVADSTRADRFEVAYEFCKKAIEGSDIRRGLVDLFKHTLTLYKSSQQTAYVRDAIALYEQNITYFPSNAFSIIDVAQCYSILKRYPQMLEHCEKAVGIPGLSAKQKASVLTRYMSMAKDYYDVSGDRALLTRILELSNRYADDYRNDFAADNSVRHLYNLVIVPYRVISECELDMAEDAEDDYTKVSPTNTFKPYLDERMAKMRERIAVETMQEEPETEEEEQQKRSEESGDDYCDDFESDLDEVQEEEADEDEGDILPYVDADGWEALGLSKHDVVEYALNINGDERTPAILAYLNAGASLNDEILPIYKVVALAANDPMESPDYSIEALVDALATSDAEYPELNDCCMAAAFLRASFLSGVGYDYSARGLRDSIAVSQRIPSLRTAYDTLEEFRKEAGRAIDIYADYRNQGVKLLMESLNETVHRAEELYTKYILTPAREDVSFARILETKKIVFARDGQLARMLSHIINRDQEALEQEKMSFSETFLNGSAQFSTKDIDRQAIDNLIVDSWDQAGKVMQIKKNSATLQGNRRNNLRSNISEILFVICQWYALSEQSAGLTWRTEEGESAYLRLRPQLMSQLQELYDTCKEEMEYSQDSQLRTGMFLLSETAKELSARLDGSWKYEQERYLYVDFLRNNYITLNDDYLPNLTSTFCALPEFNILARIRKHVEMPKYTYQEQISRIYGTDKSCNNYGTAKLILQYLELNDNAETVELPGNAPQFVEHTAMQINMRYRSFCEIYALALNYGQIIKSDVFCYTLEDTVKYWYAFCKRTKNFGFFTSLLYHAENQIHASARVYEEQLEEQLDALISNNKEYFENHSDYAEAIRVQIANQNFTAAEDWMARIRIGDFSLELQEPEALGYLNAFWNSYVDIYKRAGDAKVPLSSLLGKRSVRNKDSKGAQRLIENWLYNGGSTNASRIEQLLNLLGWHNINVSPYQFAGDTKAEIYQVCKETSAAGLSTPLHPIAAFGSNLDKKPMFAVCLYGTYDCDRLYEKFRTLNAIDGNKIILLDYALGQADRRALARKIKQRESGLRDTYMVIDRVLITYLADNYNESLVNRILMAVAMPFSYCQPYVVESQLTMPPEIFIGRKDELLKIEQPDGVNLIYGGRQLGKSALFKKALADLDGHQNQRAALIDIKDLNCAEASLKISEELIALRITPEGEVTDSWDVLRRNITNRLRSEENRISYFLLMLDEADVFIKDCANCGYRPLVVLKDIQQSLPGQFKYVLAGLHDIVKFNRQVALGNNSVITHMPSLKITPFRTPEAQELLMNPLSYLGFSLPSKVTVSQILATCNYFPGLIQLYAKKLIESMRAADYAGYDSLKTPPYIVSDAHLRRIISDKSFLQQIHEKFEITLTLDQGQGSCYYPLTLLIGWMYNESPSKSGYTAKDVLHYARDLAIHPLVDLDEEKIDALLQELQDLNILRSVSNDSYLLASKNFRDLLGSSEEIFEKLLKTGGQTA